jgi:broad specificity phosphatase PhoE
MIHLRTTMGFSELNNDYRVMRHGLSVPNEKHIVVSHLKNGVLPEYGLVPEGVEQARESSLSSGLPESTVVVTSPFSRAYHTAAILYQAINAEEFIVDERLRERYFGDMELDDDAHYRQVWDRDYVYATHNFRGVESLEDVAEREVALLTELEKKFATRSPHGILDQQCRDTATYQAPNRVSIVEFTEVCHNKHQGIALIMGLFL